MLLHKLVCNSPWSLGWSHPSWLPHKTFITKMPKLEVCSLVVFTYVCNQITTRVNIFLTLVIVCQPYQFKVLVITAHHGHAKTKT